MHFFEFRIMPVVDNMHSTEIDNDSVALYYDATCANTV